MVKNPPANAGGIRDGFDPWVRKIPWRRAWQPTPVFLPGESHGQRSLVGYSPWDHKELNTTEHMYTHNTFEKLCILNLREKNYMMMLASVPLLLNFNNIALCFVNGSLTSQWKSQATSLFALLEVFSVLLWV